MAGSIRHLGGDRWQLRVYAGTSPTTGAKRYTGRVHRGTRKTAEKALAALVTDIERGADTPGTRCTVAQLLARYVASRTPDWSPNTRRDHPATIDRWILPRLGEMDVTKVRVSDIERLVDAIAADHPSTARKVLAILRAAFEDALRWELVTRNPARSARPPRRAATRTSAPPLELVRVAIDAADDAMATIIRLAVVTGCRRGELLGLQWGDLDLDAGSVAVTRAVVGAQGALTVKGTKTGRVKVLALDAATVAAVKRWRAHCVEDSLAFGVHLAPGHFLFAQRPDGAQPWWPETLTHKWRRLADAHGLTGVRFHDLRHATATTLIAAGVDPKTAADRLGHDPSMLLGIYTHAVPARDQAAAEVMGRALDGQQ
jgi:integrase